MDKKRVAAVTGGLMIAGAVAGALASALAVGVVLLTTEPRAIFRDPELLAAGAGLGAAYGAVLGPLAAWLLMRHVPLGIAIGGTMLGTLAGGLVALLLNVGIGTLLVLPLIGFFLAVMLIRVAVPRPERIRVPR